MPEPIEELYVVIGSDISKLLRETKQGVDKAEKELKGFGDTAEKQMRRSDKFFGGIALGFAAITAAVGIAVGATKKFFSESLKLAKVQIAAEEQLAAAIKSTGGAAGLTAQELKDLASSLQDVTNFGDETIMGAESILLTFTKIGGDIFPRATKAILDVSTAMKQDLKTSTIQVGKALNDPIKGLGALTRVGIQFTDQQKKMVESLANAGDLAGAQAIILSELERQFGGSAEAARKADGGFIALSNTLGDLQEEVGRGLFEQLSGDVGNLSDKLADPKTRAGVEAIATALGKVAASLTEIVTGGAIQSITDIDPETLNQLSESLMDASAAINEISSLQTNLNGVVDSLTILIDSFTTILNVVNALSDALPNISREVAKLATPFGYITELATQLDNIGLADWFRDVAEASETEAQKMEKSREAEASRLQGLADLYAKQQVATQANDALNDSLEDTVTVSEAATKALDSYGSQLLDLQEGVNKQSVELEKEHSQNLIDIQDEYTTALADAEKERTNAITQAESQRADALAEAEKQRSESIADLERDIAKQRQDVIEGTRKDLANLEEETNRTLKKERDTFNRDELRETEDHLNSLRQLRQQYLDSISDAVKNRDARALVDARKQYQDEKSQQESAFQTDQRRRREDQDLRLQEIREQEQLRAEEIMAAQDEELRRLSETEAEKRAEIERSYQEQRQQAENAYQEAATKAQEAYEAEAEKAQERRDEQLAKEQEAYDKEKEQIDQQITERLEQIAKGLADQDDITDEEAQRILETFAKYFGADGEIDKLMEEFANRRRAKLQIQVSFETEGTTTPATTPTSGPNYNPYSVPSFQSGGSMFANRPTLVQFGEVPEVATFTPLSKMGNMGNQPQRMEIDLRLSGSAPPGIRSGDRDQIAGVLLNALMEAGFDRASGGRGQ